MSTTTHTSRRCEPSRVPEMAFAFGIFAALAWTLTYASYRVAEVLIGGAR